MTFTSPFIVPARVRADQAEQEREERHAQYDGLWIASWDGGSRTRTRRAAHVVRRQGDRRPLCGSNIIKYHHEIRYVPINEDPMGWITCGACREKAERTG